MNSTTQISWQILVAVCTCIFIVTGSAAAADVYSLPVPAPTPIHIEQVMERTVVTTGGQVPVSVRLQNDGNVPVNISRSPPEVIISLRKSGWDRGVVRRIPAGNESFSLGSHSEKRWTVYWDQMDDNGVPVRPGVYYLTLNVSGYTTNGEIIVLFPEGALTGSTSMRENCTDNRITTQITSLSLDEKSGQITALVFSPTQPEDSIPEPGFSQVTAEYQIDNNPPVNFRDYTVTKKMPGVYEIRWQTAPIPCTAATLSVRVTKFDPYYGNWNTSVDLSSFPSCILADGTQVSRKDAGTMVSSQPTAPRETPVPAIVPVIAVGFAGFQKFRRRNNSGQERQR